MNYGRVANFGFLAGRMEKALRLGVESGIVNRWVERLVDGLRIEEKWVRRMVLVGEVFLLDG